MASPKACMSTYLIAVLCLVTGAHSAKAFNYVDALDKAVLFFEAQRSGKLPPGQRVAWRADSALSDGNASNVDLVGGYYDAGDNVKFGLPMAFTVTMLSWSVVEFGGEMPPGQLANAEAAVRWGSDYLLKAATATPGALWVQVADPYQDHRCWERPEDMDTPRAAYKDELLWGAWWRPRASSPSPSSQSVYMTYINSNGHTLGGEQDAYTVSWDDKRAATKVLLSKVFLQNRVESLRPYKAHADKYICSLVPGAGGFQSQYTPGGLLFTERDSNMEYVTSTAFLLLTYAKYLSSTGGAASCGSTAVTPSTLVSLAKKQVDYILGANPAGMSYMVGFGARYPRRVHHRGASMPSVHDHPARIGCDEGFHYLHSSDPDRNVLVGAVVGGPDQSDSYSDSRDNYAQAEPSTYTNAPLVGALAFFTGAR
uniref:Endoglucanase n=1 Tax=Aegilops tauschii TaxID=37682 RepID=M8C0N3_AEGTA